NGVLGGHAVLAVGYDDAKQMFTFRNSWSAAWGSGGYGFIPEAFLIDSHPSGGFCTNPTLAEESTPLDPCRDPEDLGGRCTPLPRPAVNQFDTAGSRLSSRETPAANSGFPHAGGRWRVVRIAGRGACRRARLFQSPAKSRGRVLRQGNLEDL